MERVRRAVGLRCRGEGEEMAGGTSGPGEGVLTLVCLKCGKEYFFTDQTPPGGMTCEKCGSSVFREFFSAEGDEATEDFRDETERDLRTDDPEGDTLPGDLIDLNRGS
jgi:predicted nucleic-acid-binding Zn-ribbon protein